MARRNRRVKGRPVCCGVTNADGLLLRVLKTKEVAVGWAIRHIESGCKFKLLPMTVFSANREFARQMQLGLVDTGVIDSLLWYGGVSTKLRKHMKME